MYAYAEKEYEVYANNAEEAKEKITSWIAPHWKVKRVVEDWNYRGKWYVVMHTTRAYG